MSALGTELKINVHVEPIDGLHMVDYDFECDFFAQSRKKVKILKSEMKPIDDDNYCAIITSELAKQIGRGSIRMVIKAYIPDLDFPDGIRTEIAEVCTGIVIL